MVLNLLKWVPNWVIFGLGLFKTCWLYILSLLVTDCLHSRYSLIMVLEFCLLKFISFLICYIFIIDCLCFFFFVEKSLSWLSRERFLIDWNMLLIGWYEVLNSFKPCYRLLTFSLSSFNTMFSITVKLFFFDNSMCL